MNAETRIYEKESRQLYKKVGRKYVPHNDPFGYEGLSEGWHLIKVAKGCTSRVPVFPARAELQAAIKDKQDKIVDILLECSKAKPKEGIKLSDEASKAYNDLMEKHGNEFSILYYPSFKECADKIVEALLQKY